MLTVLAGSATSAPQRNQWGVNSVNPGTCHLFKLTRECVVPACRATEACTGEERKNKSANIHLNTCHRGIHVNMARRQHHCGWSGIYVAITVLPLLSLYDQIIGSNGFLVLASSTSNFRKSWYWTCSVAREVLRKNYTVSRERTGWIKLGPSGEYERLRCS